MSTYSNHHRLRRLCLGVRPDLVPLGFSSKLVSSDLGTHAETIDVLFVGLETAKRKTLIDKMRNSGITVVHPNAGGIEIFGTDLDKVAAKSKIVLSLNAFQSATNDNCVTGQIPCNHGEWKMARLARLLANSRCVIMSSVKKMSVAS